MVERRPKKIRYLEYFFGHMMMKGQFSTSSSSSSSVTVVVVVAGFLACRNRRAPRPVRHALDHPGPFHLEACHTVELDSRFHWVVELDLVNHSPDGGARVSARFDALGNTPAPNTHRLATAHVRLKHSCPFLP